MQKLTIQIISAFHLSVFWSVLIVKSLFSSNNQWWTIWMAWPNWLLKSHFNIFLWSETLKDNGWEHTIVLYTSFFQYGQNFMSEIDFYASICCIGYNPLYLSWRLHGTRDYWWHTRTHVTDWLLCWGWADMVTNLLQLKISKKKSLSQFQGLVNAGAAWSQWSVCLSDKPGAHGPGYYISLIWEMLSTRVKIFQTRPSSYLLMSKHYNT